MRINGKVQSELINIEVRKKKSITGKWRYILPFSNRACKAHIMLVTGFKSVIVLNEQCLNVWAETPEIAKLFWNFVFYS